MAVTIQDIADRLHLANSTVSRALNNKGQDFISEKTRQRVLTTAREMGYHPNTAARALVSKRTGMVALWTPRPYAPHYARLVYQVTRAMNVHGLEVLTKEVGLKDETDDLISTNFFSLHVDGILACDADRYLNDYLAEYPQNDTPVVGMGSYYSTNHDYVGVDNTPAAYQAVSHLAKIGCKRIAHLLTRATDHTGEWRRDAYLAMMKEMGRDAELIVCSECSRSAAYKAVMDYIAGYGCPDGLFCHNDEMAIGVYRALRKLGYHIPDDVAIIGCDGIDDTEYLEIPISTIIQPVNELCEKACQFLYHRIANPDTPLQRCLLSSSFVIRDSSQR
ncbi:MAG TPA: LacI family DNA-binding transcriptional regulator [Armatimonadota bacterium]|nr:LacI family DNA-binding transcriptional regulator [Armatimonadota bacterium]